MAYFTGHKCVFKRQLCSFREKSQWPQSSHARQWTSRRDTFQRRTPHPPRPIPARRRATIGRHNSLRFPMSRYKKTKITVPKSNLVPILKIELLFFSDFFSSPKLGAREKVRPYPDSNSGLWHFSPLFTFTRRCLVHFAETSILLVFQPEITTRKDQYAIFLTP